MATLSTILDAPVAWKNAVTDPDIKALFDDLQANIAKGHGRLHAAHVFLSFDGMEATDVAAVVRGLGLKCTSALSQLGNNMKEGPGLDGGPVRCLFLSAGGYRALGDSVKLSLGEAFLAGMESRGNILADPPRSAWNTVGWQGARPDAMFLLADADEKSLENDLEIAEGWLNGSGARVLFIEKGLQQTRKFRPEKVEGVEHFGYVDGRSQPLFLVEDIAVEDKTVWDPVFKPSQFIVADPNGRSPFSAGSYFVFRKLEQNARGFNAAELALGKALFGEAAKSPQLDRAGAMVVGRFEDGTPLVLSDAGTAAPVTNDFNYAIDPIAAKCPFHAHIRKVNPRGDIERVEGKEDQGLGRNRIMARRGITYGAERPHTADGSDFADGGHEPEADIGLLFMAYMASIEDQFEFTQQSWADNTSFAGNIGGAAGRDPTGIDPIIGQSSVASDHLHTYLDGWTEGAKPIQFNFASFVTMQGGEYFFAPSLSFLRGVGL